MSNDEELRVRILTKAETAPLDEYRKRTQALRDAQSRLGKAMAQVNDATKDLRDYKNRQSIPTITAGMDRLSRASYEAFRNLSRVGGQLGSVASIATGGSLAAGLTAAVAMTKSWANETERLKNASANIGISQAQLRRYQILGQYSGSSPDAVAAGLQALTMDRFNARINNNQPMVQAFKALGVGLTDEHGKDRSITDIFADVSDKIRRLSPAGQMTAISQLGLPPQLLPLMRRGSGWIRQNEAELKSMGFTDENYKGGSKLYEDFEKLGSAVEALKTQFAHGLSPSVDGVVRVLTKVIDEYNWITGQNSPLRKPVNDAVAAIEDVSNGVVHTVGGWFGFGNHAGGSAGVDAYKTSALRSDIRQKVIAAAQKHGVDPDFDVAIARAENGTGKYSKAGAYGTMQIMPALAHDLGINRLDENQNIDGGTRYLRQLLDRFHGRMDLAAAAYNAGPNSEAVLRYGRTGDMKFLPAETQRYVKTVQDTYRDLKNARGAPKALPTASDGASAQAGGQVGVHVSFDNLPAGASVKTAATGAAGVSSLRIGHAMPMEAEGPQ